MENQMRFAHANGTHPTRASLWLPVWLALCTIAGSIISTSAVAEPTVLRVGEINEPLALIAGIDRGYFAEQDLAIKLVPLSGGPALISATISGATDLNYGDVFSWAAAVNNGFKVRMIQSSNGGDLSPDETGGWATLLVNASSGIKGAGDLAGKKIGIAPTQLTQLLVSLWIDRHGGDSKAVKFVPVTPYLSMAAALKAGHVDAILDVDPFTQRDIKLHGFAVLGVPSRESPRTASNAGYYATEDWLKTHGDVAKRFVTAYRKAAAWANTATPDEKATVIAKYGAVNLKSLESEVPGIIQTFHYFKFDDGPVDLPKTQGWINLAVDYKLLDRSIDVSKYLYETAAAPSY